jgi:hypothetical protein
MVAESGRADLAVLQGALEHLQQMANGNAASIFAVLKKIVPAYAAAKIPAQPRIGGGRMPVIAGLTRESAMPTESSRDVIPIGERLSEPTRERRKAA